MHEKPTDHRVGTPRPEPQTPRSDRGTMCILRNRSVDLQDTHAYVRAEKRVC